MCIPEPSENKNLGEGVGSIPVDWPKLDVLKLSIKQSPLAFHHYSETRKLHTVRIPVLFTLDFEQQIIIYCIL